MYRNAQRLERNRKLFHVYASSFQPELDEASVTIGEAIVSVEKESSKSQVAVATQMFHYNMFLLLYFQFGTL